MELDNIITLKTDDDEFDVEVIEQTVINGVTYLLVATDLEEENEVEEDDEVEEECLILKEVSDSSSSEAKYVIVEGKEEEEAFEVFEKLLSADDIDLSK